MNFAENISLRLFYKYGSVCFVFSYRILYLQTGMYHNLARILNFYIPLLFHWCLQVHVFMSKQAYRASRVDRILFFSSFEVIISAVFVVTAPG